MASKEAPAPTGASGEGDQTPDRRQILINNLDDTLANINADYERAITAARDTAITAARAAYDTFDAANATYDGAFDPTGYQSRAHQSSSNTR